MDESAFHELLDSLEIQASPAMECAPTGCSISGPPAPIQGGAQPKKQQWLFYAVICLVAGGILLLIYLAMRPTSSREISQERELSVVPAFVPKDIERILDPLPTDLRDEAMRYYTKAMETGNLDEYELKSKLTNWALKWIEYKQSKLTPRTPPSPIRKRPAPPSPPPEEEELPKDTKSSRIGEHSKEVEDKIKRREARDRMMAMEANMPFSDSSEKK